MGNGDVKTEDVTSFSTPKLHKNVNLQRIRDRATKMRTELVQSFESQLITVFEDFIEDVEKIEQTDGNGTKANISKNRGKNGELPEKEFVNRRSVLTELLESSHIRTIYHIFVAILIVFSLHTIVFDLVDQGRLVLDFELLWWAFGQFPIVMWLWACMKLSTILVFPLFQYWANSRYTGKPNIVDFIWLGAYICYQIVFLVYPLRVLFKNQLPVASAVVVVCEQVRLMMKCHAFVRENIPRVIRATSKKDDDATSNGNPNGCPGFSKYLYFLFAPTLVYRDAYPRTPNIRWHYVVSNFIQVVACLIYTYYIFVRFCVPVFRNFSSESITIRALILSSFGCMMPGTLVLFIAFFAILHSWLNAFAEMLRFGDRLFYKDWWNSSSFSNYYRTWNVVVHDWLYSYVYKDCYQLFRVPNRPANRPVAMASVFLLSAVFHEYILIVSFGFFYPVLFFMFAGAGFAFIFIPSRKSRTGNVFMWVALFIGNGLLMCLYSMEWYARKNCPVTADSFLDYFIPRSWTCDYTIS